MYNEMIVDSIKILCKENGISISQLEADLNFKPFLIDGWSSTDPSLDEVVDVANYFKISLDDLMLYSYVKAIKNNFLKALIEQTQNGNIKWRLISLSEGEELHKYISADENLASKRDVEIYKEISFYTEYVDKYIIIYGIYKNDQVMEPNELYLLFRQKTQDDVKIIRQKYDKQELILLYLNIFDSLD